ncbi:DNA recombination protein RmuC [Ensifer soli]|uniref:DNA recombination protein RmuC n=1 Tax=Ciceribacter sp. sgz301302 TaxID=3342379 RepID=UPI0035B84C36
MSDLALLLDRTLLVVGGHAVSTGAALLAALGVLLLLAGIGALRRRAGGSRIDAMLAQQAELQGRLAALAEVFGARQSELNRSIGERLDGMSAHLGQSMHEQTRATHDNLRRLQERLAVIDNAQTNIQALARDMAGLQAILANKQARGAFGQSRMEAIIADGLPIGAYGFQQPLSNGTRPDCLIRMPNGQPPLVIDAKFPLEAWNRMREAREPDGIRAAQQQFRRDMDVHIRDVATKYLLPGETQETAFLFVPSESVFADLHEHFEPLILKAQRARIVIVSPSLLMLAVSLIQSMMRDQRMREQAHLIQAEVARLSEDLARLDERVRKLGGHFAAAQKDVDEILVTTTKLKRHGARIAALEPDDGEAPPPRAEARDPRAPLKLRVVDED